MNDLKLNSTIVSIIFALAIISGVSAITTTYKNIQDIAINEIILEELQHQKATESRTSKLKD